MKGITEDNEATEVIKDYSRDELHFAGTLNECAQEIQKDFGKFVQHIKQLNN